MTSPAAKRLLEIVNDHYEAQTVIGHLSGTTDPWEASGLDRAKSTAAAFAQMMTRDEFVEAIANLLDTIRRDRPFDSESDMWNWATVVQEAAHALEAAITATETTT